MHQGVVSVGVWASRHWARELDDRSSGVVQSHYNAEFSIGRIVFKVRDEVCVREYDTADAMTNTTRLMTVTSPHRLSG